MTTININTWCRRCGIEFTADRGAILAGTWRRQCPTCPPPDRGNSVSTMCIGCGRPLRAGSRPVCVRCIAVTP